MVCKGLREVTYIVLKNIMMPRLAGSCAPEVRIISLKRRVDRREKALVWMRNAGLSAEAFADAVGARLNTNVDLVSTSLHSVPGKIQPGWAAYMEVKVGEAPACFGCAVESRETAAALAAVASAVNRVGVGLGVAGALPAAG